MADRVAAWFIEQWGSRSAATVNVRLNALASASGWWRDQGWIIEDPLRRLKRRPVEADRTRSQDRAEVAELLGREGVALRERTLWRLLGGRRTGPVFTTDRRARVELPPADIDVHSGIEIGRSASWAASPVMEVNAASAPVQPAAACAASPSTTPARRAPAARRFPVAIMSGQTDAHQGKRLAHDPALMFLGPRPAVR
ncbi:hypothetical protein [Microtetraspora malaysiensis]|uniref:hypothetical protein n=1 Tax=Microtetraspora malaysiensis TaxID=161358 RepID=UPI003D8CB1FB